MTDQKTLERIYSIKEKYKDNPVAFVEDFYKVKLYPWQKVILNAIHKKDKIVSYFIPYRHGKAILQKGQLEYMKAMEMDFSVWNKDGIEVYEKGVLVRTIKSERS